MYSINRNRNRTDESECLISPIAKVRQSSERIQQLSKGIWFNRINTIVVFILLGVYTLYSQSQISQLTLQMEDMTDRMQRLEVTSQQQTTVIERFNSSITNRDIVEELHRLQQNFTITTHDLHSELRHTKETIQNELVETIRTLNTTVDAAEIEISNQVAKVKTDVEQYVITTQDQFSMENSFMVYQLAGTFTVLSCLISMWHMTQHLRKLHQPNIQRKILAILWMSPIYAITSWFSLVFHSAEGYLAILKDFYEAYVIYQFLSFCIAVLGKGDRNVVVDLLAQQDDANTGTHHLTPPFRLFSCCEVMTCGRCCIAPQYESSRHLADAILLQCQLFAVQFVFFRPATTTAMVILQKMNYYGPTQYLNQMNPDDPMNHFYSPQFYITIVQNISIFVAFTGLLKFYHAVDKELAWCRPFAKFLCIKGVVFMTFWQGLVLSILAQTTDVGGASKEDANEWAKSAQNFLICLEMLLFSIAHFYCFPTEEWEDGYRVKHSDTSTFGDSIALGDFLADLKLILKTGKKSKKVTKKKLLTSSSSPPPPSSSSSSLSKHNPTIPEGDDESDGHQTSDMTSTTSSSMNNNHSGNNSKDGDHDDDGDENDDDVDQVEDGVGATNNVDTNDDNDDDDNQVIARALQESLGELADDPDIAEATKRLLESKILTPSFFDYSHKNNHTRSTQHSTDQSATQVSTGSKGSTTTLAAETNGTMAAAATTNYITPQRNDIPNDDSDIDAFLSEFTTTPHRPTEQTSLLSSSSSTTPSLRPSIFTTIASSIAESEDTDPYKIA